MEFRRLVEEIVLMRTRARTGRRRSGVVAVGKTLGYDGQLSDEKVGGVAQSAATEGAFHDARAAASDRRVEGTRCGESWGSAGRRRGSYGRCEEVGGAREGGIVGE